VLPPRALPPALLLACLAACENQTVSPDREYTLVLDKPRVVEKNPFAVAPEDAVDREFLWLQALDRSDVGDAVAPDIERALFGEELALSLADLYVELWHDGGPLARALLHALRDCDANAVIRFGAPLVLAAAEIEPLCDWPLELRYLEGDPRGRAAAELLRDHLREACSGAAHDALRAIVAEHGLVLRPVAAFPYSADVGNLSPLMLVVQPGGQALAERGSEF